jgi:uncharacterized protein YndB with AHSA1/START domain
MSCLLLLVTTASGAAERAIERDALINAPVEQVWEAWTTSAGIKSFFAPDAQVELRVDGPFQIYIDPLAEPGMKGADDMRILAFQDKQMLSFTWNAPPNLPQARKQRTVVILRFRPEADGKTRVSLHHTGWGEGGEWDKAYAYFERAWPNVLANLGKRFVSGPIDWTEWLEALRKMHAPQK